MPGCAAENTYRCRQLLCNDYTLFKQVTTLTEDKDKIASDGWESYKECMLQVQVVSHVRMPVRA